MTAAQLHAMSLYRLEAGNEQIQRRRYMERLPVNGGELDVRDEGHR